MKNKVCFLVHTGDKSHKIWDTWYKYYKNHWTCERFVDTVFLSEKKTVDYKGVISETTGNVSWADGLINYLIKCNYEHIIYQHEDYFLTEETNNIVLSKLIDLVRENDIKLLKCCGWWSGWTNELTPLIEADIGIQYAGEFRNIWKYHPDSAYLISHQTSIWEKDFLLSTLEAGETPWCHELGGTARLKERNIPIYSYRQKSPLEYGETIQHSRVRPDCGKYFDNFNDGDNIE